MREGLLRRVINFADDDARFAVGIPNMWGSLRNLARNGFAPSGVIDVGAHKGLWAKAARDIFPRAAFLLIEPQKELEPHLVAVGLPYIISLLGPEPRDDVPFFVDHDWPTGGSVMEEVTAFSRDTLTLPMRRLDDLAQEIAGPMLLKLDVQGFELEVLKGASATLDRTEVVLMEVALLEYNKGAPLLHEVIAFMAERGFVPYDICDGMRRSSDRALFQCDVIFAREGSPLRQRRQFFENEPMRD